MLPIYEVVELEVIEIEITGFSVCVCPTNTLAYMLVYSKKVDSFWSPVHFQLEKRRVNSRTFYLFLSIYFLIENSIQFNK